MMATAEANMQRKEEEARMDGSPITPTRSSKHRKGTRQLDFFQAMRDFKQMFPTLEDDVIEAVLRANDGAVDATIDQLLTMTIDQDVTETFTPEMAMAQCPKYGDQDVAAGGQSEDSPPSYSEAMRSGNQQTPVQSIWTTPIGQSFSGSNTTDSFGSPDVVGAAASGSSGFNFSARSSISENRSFSDLQQSTQRKKEFKNWNPPMLGSLPDDFLRLNLPAGSGSNSAKINSERKVSLSTTPVSVMSLTDARPKVHKSRKSDKLSKSFSVSHKDGKDRDSKSSEKKSKSEKMSRSVSVKDDSSISHGQKVSRSHSGRTRDRVSWQREINGVSPSHRGMIIETHDFSKGMLDERMKENERRRKRTSMDIDPELTQYLEDERLAIALQNSEFLQELRGNEDFMKTLKRDQANSSSKSEPVLEPLPKPLDDVHEGYGDDHDKTLGAFPFSQPLPKDKDEDAVLRQQLSGMGKASKKQLASLARKFFRRKKKTSKQILGEKLAPSMMNLLDDEDEEEDDSQIDPRYGNSPPEIEPLPSSLIGVPHHRTTGMTSNGFDNKRIDIV